MDAPHTDMAVLLIATVTDVFPCLCCPLPLDHEGVGAFDGTLERSNNKLLS